MFLERCGIYLNERGEICLNISDKKGKERLPKKMRMNVKKSNSDDLAGNKKQKKE